LIESGDVVSYVEMCQEEGVILQRGMNYRLRGDRSLILMSLRSGAPYADRIDKGGRVLIYEGHDSPKIKRGPDPKHIDQPLNYPGGRPTQNGLFFEAAKRFKTGKASPEVVKVYEKIKNGIWAFNGLFILVDAWTEESNARKVFKFRLELTDPTPSTQASSFREFDHNRLIPTSVKLAVWRRDKGKCVLCGSRDNLHFDHIIPYSKGGSSLVAENIQLLCVRHNLAKRDKIE
jgi:HNH endonuclease